MTYARPERITIRRTRIRRGRVAGLLAVLALAAVLCDQLLATSSSTDGGQRSVRRGVTELDPVLLGAVRRAATDAAAESVELHIESGWRSAAYQQRLFDDAVAKYGSQEQAARWVATPDRSAHVSGEAVDIGPPAAAAWLSAHGAAYGLCQIYANEPWHYELRPDATVHGCPPMYADPTHDPRLQR